MDILGFDEVLFFSLDNIYRCLKTSWRSTKNCNLFL